MKEDNKEGEIKIIKEIDINKAFEIIDRNGVPRNSFNNYYWVESDNGNEYPFKELVRTAYKNAIPDSDDIKFVSSQKNRDIIEKLGFKINHHPQKLNFFKLNELKNYSTVAGKSYRKAIKRDVRYGQLIHPNVKKINHWAKESLVEDFIAQRDMHWQWSGTFKRYLWIRLYRKGDSKKVFFVLGINGNGELYLELNCQVSNHTGGSTKALSDEKVKAFKNYLLDTTYGGKVLGHNYINNGNWTDLISFTKEYIYEYISFYDELEALMKEKLKKEHTFSGLVLGNVPDSTKSYVDRERNYKGFDIDWGKRNRNSEKLGKSGEKLVKEFEIQKLLNLGFVDLSKQVEKVKDGRGFDILSYDKNKDEIFIEVKTTKSNSDEPFYLSINEREFCKENTEQYFVYRLYNYSYLNKSANHYILTAQELLNLTLTSISFEVSKKK